MNFEHYGDVKIYRPSRASELRIRRLAESELREAYEAGTYTDREKILQIFRHHTNFYVSRLNSKIDEIAREDFLFFLLFQYDQSGVVRGMLEEGKLSQEETQSWQELGPVYRRVLKFLAEQACSYGSTIRSRSDADLMASMDDVFVAAEEMTKIYMSCDAVSGLLPDGSELEIAPLGEHNYLNLKTPFDLSDTRAEVFRETEHRNKIINRTEVFFDLPWLNAQIGQALRDSFGFDLLQIRDVLSMIINRTQPIPNGFPVYYLHKKNTIDAISREAGLAPEQVSRIIDGFSLTKDNMQSEGRELWKPKQEYRALRRGFFIMPHGTGDHITFSKVMANESVGHLLNSMGFQKLPPEWNTRAVEKAMAVMSNKVGDWFEEVTKDALQNEGISGGVGFSTGIGLKKSRVMIDKMVGQIDCLGYLPSDDLIILGECKCVQPASEPRLFQDDFRKFVHDEKKESYAERFRKKIEWVRSNFPAVVIALKSEGIVPASATPHAFAPVIITYYSNIAQHFIDDFPVKSLPGLILDLRRTGHWPYPETVVTL